MPKDHPVRGALDAVLRLVVVVAAIGLLIWDQTARRPFGERVAADSALILVAVGLSMVTGRTRARRRASAYLGMGPGAEELSTVPRAIGPTPPPAPVPGHPRLTDGQVQGYRWSLLVAGLTTAAVWLLAGWAAGVLVLIAVGGMATVIAVQLGPSVLQVVGVRRGADDPR